MGEAGVVRERGTVQWQLVKPCCTAVINGANVASAVDNNNDAADRADDP